MDAAYQRSMDIHQKIEALYARVDAHGAYFRGLMKVDPVFRRPVGAAPGTRVDLLVCGLAVKAATTKRAVLLLCESGDGDNALALARVLLENACLLEWLIRGEGRRRLEAYALFLSVAHERIVETIKRHADRFIAAGAESLPESDPYHHDIWTHIFRDRKGNPTKSERPTWDFNDETRTGKPASVGDMFREIAKISEEDEAPSFEYDVLYGAMGSDVVHSGPFHALRMHRLMGNGRFFLRPEPMIDYRTIALASSNSAMFLVLDAYSQFIGLDLKTDLDALKAESKVDPYQLSGGGNQEPA